LGDKYFSNGLSGTMTGFSINLLLKRHFTQILNCQYTVKMNMLYRINRIVATD